MNVIKFNDEAKRLNVSIEAVRTSFEKALSEEKIHGIIVPEEGEIIRFKLAECLRFFVILCPKLIFPTGSYMTACSGS